MDEPLLNDDSKSSWMNVNQPSKKNMNAARERYNNNKNNVNKTAVLEYSEDKDSEFSLIAGPDTTQKGAPNTQV